MKHLPNFFTACRLAVAPLIIYYFVKSRPQVGLSLFVFACLSDFLDGYLAKKFQATSKIGSFLDPIADKVLIIALFSLLMSYQKCPSWFLGLLITINLLQCLGLALLKLPAASPKSPFSPLRAGKINTALQFFWAGILLIDVCIPRFDFNEILLGLGMLLMATLQIVVFFRYFFRFKLLLGKHLALSSFRNTTQ